VIVVAASFALLLLALILWVIHKKRAGKFFILCNNRQKLRIKYISNLDKGISSNTPEINELTKIMFLFYNTIILLD